MTNIPLIGAAVTAISRACDGFWGCFFPASPLERTVNKKALNNRLESYNQMLHEIDAERTFILDSISNPAQSRQGNPYSLFSDDTKLSKSEVENKEFITRFYELFNSYPEFSAAQEKIEPDYVARIQQETMTHHETVKTLATEYFRRVDCAEHQRAQLMLGTL